MLVDPLNPATLPELDEGPPSRPRGAPHILVLAVLWCGDEPWRVGEVLLAPTSEAGTAAWFGRGAAEADGPPKRHLSQQRPGLSLPSSALNVPSISRYQLRLETVDDEHVRLSNEGKARLFHNGNVVSEAQCGHGDLVQIGRQLLLGCFRRVAPPRPSVHYPDFAFGRADAHGIVGESADVWQLRYRMAFVAARLTPVLVHGPRGSGKELVALGIHALSPRRDRQLISTSGATLSPAVVDTELFGTNDQSVESGLVAAAHGSTLFVDDFEALPVHTQARLLQAVDSRGPAKPSHGGEAGSDFRLIAATRDDPSSLDPGVAARFGFAVKATGLNARREDIPLLMRHLLQQDAERRDPVALRCFPAENPQNEPELPLVLVQRLVQWNYTTNVRELRAELWRHLAEMRLGFGDERSSDTLRSGEGPSVSSQSSTSITEAPPSQPSDADASSNQLTPQRLQEALDRNNGVLEVTWRALGLKNRFVLLRLIKRFDLQIRKRPAQSGLRTSKR